MRKAREQRPPKRYTVEAYRASADRWMAGHDGYPLTLDDEYIVVEAVGLATEIKYMGRQGWWTPWGYAKTLGDLRAINRLIISRRASEN